MRLSITIEVNCGSGLLLTVKKNLFATRESILEIVQTALRGDTDIANIIGSISQHIACLPELGGGIVPDLDLEVYVHLPIRILNIKYAEHQTNVWRICTSEISRFLAIEVGHVWRFIEHMSFLLNVRGTISGRTSNPPPSRA